MTAVKIPWPLVEALIYHPNATLTIEQGDDKWTIRTEDIADMPDATVKLEDGTPWIATVNDVGDIIAYGTGPTPGVALRDAARDLAMRNEERQP